MIKMDIVKAEQASKKNLMLFPHKEDFYHVYF